MAWRFQEAKQMLSKVVDRSNKDGPQTITRRGAEVAVIISIDEYRRLTDCKPSLAEFLLSRSEPYFDDLELERSEELPGIIEW